MGSPATTGAGGDGPLPGDRCEDTVAIQLTANGVANEVDGSTAEATNDFMQPCTNRSTAGDVVYALELLNSCVLRAEVAPLDVGYNPAFTLQAACAVFDDADFCVNAGPANGIEQLTVPLGSGTYYLVVDGADETRGAFHLSVTCNPPMCGDGVVSPWTGEECDDGNTVDGDGCSDTCSFEPSLELLDDCFNAESEPPILIDQGQVFFAPSAAQFATTLGASDSGTPPCVSDGTPSPDHVAKIVSLVDGTLTATVGTNAMFQDACEMNGFVCGGGCFDLAIWATTDGCASSGNTVACSADPDDAHSTETISFPVTAGQEYFVIVDGHQEPLGCSSGSYLLALKLL